MMPEGLLTMSTQEINRVAVIQRVAERSLKQKKAMDLLSLSKRQIIRLVKNYRREGAKALTSKRRGQSSNHRYNDTIKAQAKKLVHQHYSDFGPTLAAEKLEERDKIVVSKETLRQWMILWGLWDSKRHKTAVIHPQRERRACFGELVQIDGSPHAWFEERGSKCCLLVFIDDATSQIVGMRFEPTETTEGYFKLAREYIERYGMPLAFYNDKHSIFRINRPSASEHAETQFSRAMRELSVTIICAHSAQAKGRVERANETLQDRLIKELRLRGINTIQDGNAFLPEYIKIHNSKFAVNPRSNVDAHRKALPEKEKLDRIFSYQEDRKITKNLEISYKNKIYQIRTNTKGYRLQHALVTVCEDMNGGITILNHGKILDHVVYEKAERRNPEIVDAKQLGIKLDEIKKNIPKANHPWRQATLHSARSIAINKKNDATRASI